MYMRRYGIIPTARMTGIRFDRCKTADAILEEFKILYKKVYKVKVLNNIRRYNILLEILYKKLFAKLT